MLYKVCPLCFYIASLPANSHRWIHSCALMYRVYPHELVHWNHGAITHELPHRGKFIPVSYAARCNFSGSIEQKQGWKAKSTAACFTIHKASTANHRLKLTYYSCVFWFLQLLFQVWKFGSRQSSSHRRVYKISLLITLNQMLKLLYGSVFTQSKSASHLSDCAVTACPVMSTLS